MKNQTTKMEELIKERQELAQDLFYCERGAFPGSEDWREENRCMSNLDKFDAEHPEVIAEIKKREAEKKAKTEPRWI